MTITRKQIKEYQADLVKFAEMAKMLRDENKKLTLELCLVYRAKDKQYEKLEKIKDFVNKADYPTMKEELKEILRISAHSSSF